MKSVYKNIDVLSSLNNANTQQEKIENVIKFLENEYEYNFDNSEWKCNAKNQFIKKILSLKQLFKELNIKINAVNETLVIINKIQELSRQIENLEKKNELLKNSLNPSDKLEIVQNNKTIEQYLEHIMQLENKIETFGW